VMILNSNVLIKLFMLQLILSFAFIPYSNPGAASIFRARAISTLSF